MFGLTFEKLVVIGIVALFIIGPERLPKAAAKLAELVKTVRSLTNTAKERVREELGPDFDDVDWQKLDPRQYDPRRIIREALLDDDEDDDAPRVSLVKKAPPPAAEAAVEAAVEAPTLEASTREPDSEAA